MPDEPDEQKPKLHQFRDTTSWHRRLRVAAAMEGLSLADFVRRAVHERVRTVEEREGLAEIMAPTA